MLPFYHPSACDRVGEELADYSARVINCLVMRSELSKGPLMYCRWLHLSAFAVSFSRCSV